MLLNHKKNSLAALLLTATIFSAPFATAQTTTIIETTSHTTQTHPQTAPTTKQVEVATAQHKQDIGSSAYTLGATIMTSVFPTATSEATSGKNKQNKALINAKNDAASFIASNGQLRGVYLESAFQQLRKHIPTSQANDNQLAQAILSL